MVLRASSRVQCSRLPAQASPIVWNNCDTGVRLPGTSHEQRTPAKQGQLPLPQTGADNSLENKAFPERGHGVQTRLRSWGHADPWSVAGEVFPNSIPSTCSWLEGTVNECPILSSSDLTQAPPQAQADLFLFLQQLVRKSFLFGCGLPQYPRLSDTMQWISFSAQYPSLILWETDPHPPFKELPPLQHHVIPNH